MSLYQANPTFFMPSDQQRIRDIKLLLDNGYEDSVVVAHDVHTKHRLVSIILNYIFFILEIPSVCKVRGKYQTSSVDFGKFLGLTGESESRTCLAFNNHSAEQTGYECCSN